MPVKTKSTQANKRTQKGAGAGCSRPKASEMGDYTDIRAAEITVDILHIIKLLKDNDEALKFMPVYDFAKKYIYKFVDTSLTSVEAGNKLNQTINSVASNPEEYHRHKQNIREIERLVANRLKDLQAPARTQSRSGPGSSRSAPSGSGGSKQARKSRR